MVRFQVWAASVVACVAAMSAVMILIVRVTVDYFFWMGLVKESVVALSR